MLTPLTEKEVAVVPSQRPAPPGIDSESVNPEMIALLSGL